MPSAGISDATTILVPVDFDDASRRAVTTAVAFAKALRGRVIILHVIAPTSFPEGTRVLPVDASDPIDVSEFVSGRARRLLDEHFASVLVGGVEVRKEARSGHPVESILHAIEECGAELVVVGTHGRSGVARFVLGSVAENLLRRSRVPVMVVRDSEVPSAHVADGPFAGAAFVSGVVAGAATGVVVGPIGAAVGSAIGGVVGALAGTVVEREQARAEAHDHDLDEVIGVTRGSLGTPPETKRPSNVDGITSEG